MRSFRSANLNFGARWEGVSIFSQDPQKAHP